MSFISVVDPKQTLQLTKLDSPCYYITGSQEALL